MSVFKIALAQYPISYHDSLQAWSVFVEKWVRDAIENKAQVLVFPEYGSLELCSLLSKDVQSNLRQQLVEIQMYIDDFKRLYSELAKKHKVYILAPSIPVQVNDKFVNRAFFFNPYGQIDYQDKINMTRFEDESWHVSSPDEWILKVFQTSFGSIGVNICFDSEFSQLSFEQSQFGLQVLLAPSCTESLWGLKRVHVGCQARALENQIFVAQCSTVGDAPWSPAVDKNTGQAMVFTPADKGFPAEGYIVKGELNKPQWVYADIDLSKINEVRNNGHVFNYKKSSQNMISNPKFKTMKLNF